MAPKAERGGEFFFNPRTHEPGVHRLLGRDFPAGGIEQGRDALLMLARHPATAKHIAFKLARHFVADAPPPSLVDRLARRFHETDGDLKEIAKTLVLAPEAGEAAPGKLRPPTEWLLGTARATGILPDNIYPLLNEHSLLGQPLWKPPAPKGFADESAAWLDGLAARLDIANQVARRDAAWADARAIAEDAFGPLLSQETRQAVARAESRQQALTLLLMSPEFQRR